MRTSLEKDAPAKTVGGTNNVPRKNISDTNTISRKTNREANSALCREWMVC
jgi:hypothetical protein